jgi:anti-sigma B factor antagonist
VSEPTRRKPLELEEISDITVINFVDKKIIDERDIQIIGEQLFGLVDNEGCRKMLLTFSNVEYLSSAALGKLITLNTKMQHAQGRVVWCKLDPAIYENFEITSLNRFFAS